MSFKTDLTFNSSHKMDNAAVSWDKLHYKLGQASEYNGDKSDAYWGGTFTANDGKVMRASVWDWKGALKAGYGASIWVDEAKYIDEFKRWLEA